KRTGLPNLGATCALSAVVAAVAATTPQAVLARSTVELQTAIFLPSRVSARALASSLQLNVDEATSPGALADRMAADPAFTRLLPYCGAVPNCCPVVRAPHFLALKGGHSLHELRQAMTSPGLRCLTCGRGAASLAADEALLVEIDGADGILASDLEDDIT